MRIDNEIKNDHKAKIGLPILITLVVANMIGAGVFTTSGFALADLYSPHLVMLAWIIGGIIAICGAISYGMLAKQISESGGEYIFLSRNLHPAAGFISGIVSMFAGFTGAIAFAALTIEFYTKQNFPSIPEGIIASLLIILSSLLHSFSHYKATWLQTLVVIMKLLFLCTFIMFMFLASNVNNTHVSTNNVGFLPLATTIMWISFSYSGFNAAVYIAEEVHNPTKNIPRALLIGTVLVTILYLLLNACFVYLVPLDVVTGQYDIAAKAAYALGGENVANATRTVIVIALFTSVSSMMMLGPRVYSKMAVDGWLPEFLKSSSHIPIRTILFQAVLALILIWVADLRELLSYLGFTLSLSTAITVSTLIKYRKHYKEKHLLYTIAPVFYVTATICLAVLAAFHKPIECAAGVVTILGGILLYKLILIKKTR